MYASDIQHEIIKATPATSVSILSLCGLPLSECVYILTLFYIVVQVVCLIYKTFFKKEEKKDDTE